MIKVLLADDETLIRDALAALLALEDGLEVVAVAASGTEALAAARAHMIATLNSFREALVDLGGGLGVTDPISGPVVLSVK